MVKSLLLIVKALSKYMDTMHKATTALSVVFLFFTVIIMTYAVVARYLTSALFYGEPFVVIMLVWTVFLLIGSVARRDEHIRIGFFVNKLLGKRASPFIYGLESVASLALCIYFAYWGIRWVQLAMIINEGISYNELGDEYPAWIPYIIAPGGLIIAATFYLERIVRQARSIYHNIKAKPTEHDSSQ
ncbi:TRAP transporter small permease [Chloroflexota bacterium]